VPRRHPAANAGQDPSGAASSSRTVGPLVGRIARALADPGEGTVGLVALLVRLASLTQLVEAPSFYFPIIDERSYDRLARGLVAGHALEPQYFWQSTAYPVFLAAVYALTHGSILAARLAQAILGAATAALTYGLGERLGGRRVGRIAGFTTALYGPLIFSEFELVATGWETFFSVSLSLVALRAGATPRGRWLLLLGVTGGLAIATRGLFAVYVVGLAVWLAVRLARQPGARRAKVGRMSLFAGGVLAVLVPIAALNRRTTGHFGVLPSSGGINLYIGNNPDRDRTLQVRPGPEWDRLASLPAEHGAVTPYAKDAFFTGLVVDYAKERPAHFLAGLGEKALELFSSREIARNLDVHAYRPYSAVLSVLTWRVGPFGFPFGVLFPLSVLGAALSGRRLPPPLGILLIVYPCAIVLVFPSARYRAPLVPPLAVVAALAIESLAAAAREGRWATLGGYGAVMAGALVASSWPGPFAVENGDRLAEMWTLVANVHMEAGRVDEAEALLTRALGRDPDNEMAHGILGAVRTRRGEYDAAALQFEQALRLEPAYADAHRGLGNVYLLTGKPDRALEQYRQALEVDRDDASLLNNVGQLLHRAGDEAGAADSLRRALSIDPTLAVAHFNLGEVLRTSGDLAQAASHYRKALALRRAPEAALALARLEMDPGQPGLYDLDEATALAQFAAAATELGDAESVAVLAEAFARRGQVEAARSVVAGAIVVARSNRDATALEYLEQVQRALSRR
jgi:Tfp pilus assembly protein PilF